MTSEADTCRKFDVPELQLAGWDNQQEVSRGDSLWGEGWILAEISHNIARV